MPTIARAHTDSNGRRWEIGENAEAHPDRVTHPWLFADMTVGSTTKAARAMSPVARQGKRGRSPRR